MLSGELSQENLTQTLRELSQKKRHGILQLECADNKIEIIFSAGRIVDCQDVGEVKTKGLLGRIADLGLVPHDTLGQDYPDTYQALFTAIKEQSPTITPDDFKELLTHWVLDKLYSIDFDRPGRFSFNVKVPEFERAFSASISVGQLLLDLVALNTDYAQFDQIIPATVFLVRTAEEAGDLSADEELIFAAIGNGITRASLRKRIYLSEYPFREALLALREKGLVDIALKAPEGAVPAGQTNVLAPKVSQPLVLTKTESLTASEPDRRPGLVARLNHYLLHSTLVPEILVITFLASALVVPLLFWKTMFLQF